jgi:hypothetical protein
MTAPVLRRLLALLDEIDLALTARDLPGGRAAIRTASRLVLGALDEVRRRRT